MHGVRARWVSWCPTKRLSKVTMNYKANGIQMWNPVYRSSMIINMSRKDLAKIFTLVHGVQQDTVMDVQNLQGGINFDYLGNVKKKI